MIHITFLLFCIFLCATNCTKSGNSSFEKTNEEDTVIFMNNNILTRVDDMKQENDESLYTPHIITDIKMSKYVGSSAENITNILKELIVKRGIFLEDTLVTYHVATGLNNIPKLNINPSDSFYFSIYFSMESMYTEYSASILSNKHKIRFNDSEYSRLDVDIWERDLHFLKNWDDHTSIKEFINEDYTEPPIIVLIRILIDNSMIDRIDRFIIEYN